MPGIQAVVLMRVLLFGYSSGHAGIKYGPRGMHSELIPGCIPN